MEWELYHPRLCASMTEYVHVCSGMVLTLYFSLYYPSPLLLPPSPLPPSPFFLPLPSFSPHSPFPHSLPSLIPSLPPSPPLQV